MEKEIEQFVKKSVAALQLPHIMLWVPHTGLWWWFGRGWSWDWWWNWFLDGNILLRTQKRGQLLNMVEECIDGLLPMSRCVSGVHVVAAICISWCCTASSITENL